MHGRQDAMTDPKEFKVKTSVIRKFVVEPYPLSTCADLRGSFAIAMRMRGKSRIFGKDARDRCSREVRQFLHSARL